MFFNRLKIYCLFLLLLITTDAFAGEAEDIESLRSVYSHGNMEIVSNMGAVFLKKYSHSKNEPEVLFLMASAASNFQVKKNYFKQIKERFYNTPWAAQAYLELGKIYLLKSDSSAAVKEFASINIKHRESSIFGESLYLMALSKLANGAFHKSRLLFKEALSTNTKLKVKSLIGIADTFYLSGDYRKSLSHYQQILLLELNDEYMTKAMLNLALSHTALSQNKKAFHLFRRIVEKYPSSLEAFEASEQLLFLNKSEEDENVSGGTYLQVAVYSTLASATLYESGLKNMGFKTYILEGEVYKVLLGPFSDDIEAQIYAGKLREEKGIDSFVFEK